MWTYTAGYFHTIDSLNSCIIKHLHYKLRTSIICFWVNNVNMTDSEASYSVVRVVAATAWTRQWLSCQQLAVKFVSCCCRQCEQLANTAPQTTKLLDLMSTIHCILLRNRCTKTEERDISIDSQHFVDTDAIELHGFPISAHCTAVVLCAMQFC